MDAMVVLKPMLSSMLRRTLRSLKKITHTLVRLEENAKLKKPKSS
jgi:hypothetical protein